MEKYVIIIGYDKLFECDFCVIENAKNADYLIELFYKDNRYKDCMTQYVKKLQISI